MINSESSNLIDLTDLLKDTFRSEHTNSWSEPVSEATTASIPASEAYESDRLAIVNVAGQIVSSYVSKNVISKDELPSLITATIDAIDSRMSGRSARLAQTKTTVDPNQTVFPDHIVSLEDGKSYKALKRHLRKFGMSPDDYRRKWGLPSDYPMVAENYSKARSQMAKDTGLGSSRLLRAAA